MNIEEERKAFESVCHDEGISVTRTDVALMFANGKRMATGDYFEPAYTGFVIWLAAKAHAKEMAEQVTAAGVWRDGPPPSPWSSESFLAEVVHGNAVSVLCVLMPLPTQYTHDFTTADGTFVSRKNIKRWAQLSDSEYVEPDGKQIKPVAFINHHTLDNIQVRGELLRVWVRPNRSDEDDTALFTSPFNASMLPPGRDGNNCTYGEVPFIEGWNAYRDEMLALVSGSSKGGGDVDVDADGGGL